MNVAPISILRRAVVASIWLPGLMLPSLLHAQNGAVDPSASSSSDERIILTPFEVSADKVGQYQASEATSGGRVRADLFSETQSISVITNALIQDSGATDLLSATQLLAGVSNNSQPFIDRLSIRGFQVNNAGSVDGFFLPATGTKMDPVEFERIELVRGPSAILSPVGSPGGTMNLVTKVAQFADFGSATAELGRFNTNRGDIDLNRLVRPDLAFRVVGGYENYTQGDNQGYRQSVTVLPSLAWNIGPASRLVIEYTYRWASQFNGLGFPIDPSVGTTSGLHLLSGLNRYQSGYADDINDPTAKLHDNTQNYNALFTSKLTDALSMRVAARYFTGWESYNQWNLLGNTGGAYNPLTGLWTPGFSYGPAPTFTAVAAAPTTGVYSVSQSPGNVLNHYADLQNDYVYDFKTTFMQSQTTAGFAGEIYRVSTTGNAYASPPINLYAIPRPAVWTPATTLVNDTYARGSFEQIYLNENLRLWNNRVVINGGAAQTWYRETIYDYLRQLTYSTTPTPLYKNYGVDFQPVPFVSIYYGHSENAVQLDSPPSATAPTPDLQASKQDEEGLRFRFLNDHGTFTVDHYNLSQTNNTVVNPALFSNPPPTITPPPLLLDRTARGWEYELNVSLNNELSVIANYTNFRNRTPLGVPFRGTAESSGAAWLYYTFKEGSLKGFSCGAEYTYEAKRPGDTGSGVAAGSTPTGIIPTQPSFYIPSYSLVNLSSAYRWNKFIVRVFVDNVLNKTYYSESLNRNAVYPGIPVNPRASLTYSF